MLVKRKVKGNWSRAEGLASAEAARGEGYLGLGGERTKKITCYLGVMVHLPPKTTA